MTKKEINALNLEFDDPIVVMLYNREFVWGRFRNFGNYVIFVDKNRLGYVLLPDQIRKIRKVQERLVRNQ